MASVKRPIKAVILVGGPSLGTRFRPLSLDLPKPLFPLAMKPLLWQHFRALAELHRDGPSTVLEVIVMGFYDFSVPHWSTFLDEVRREFFLNVRTIHEGGDEKLGTAGGLRASKDDIETGEPTDVILLHGDIVCEFPLIDMMKTHLSHEGVCTVLGKQVAKDDAQYFGVLGLEPEPKSGPRAVLHYAEKPKSFVNDIINCGVYIFRREALYQKLAGISSKTQLSESTGIGPQFLRLEQDVLPGWCNERQLFLHQVDTYWFQLKTVGNTLRANSAQLQRIRTKYGPKGVSPYPSELREIDNKTIIGNVLIHKTARVDPSAKIGPDVVIGPGVFVGEGARIKNTILLDNCHIGERSLVMNAILGWSTSVGKWARVEGVLNYSQALDENAGVLPSNCGCVITGTGVSIADESVVRASIVLPHKSLSGSYSNEILL